MNIRSCRARAALVLLLSIAAEPASAQTESPRRAAPSFTNQYQAVSDSLIRAATRDSAAYTRLGQLVDGFGHRLSGSASLEAAIDWILTQMKKDGLENVHGERVMVPHWVRGEESAELITPR